jgi:hypothetical protein
VVIRWAFATVTALVVTGFAFLLLTGRYPNDGRVVVEVTRDHGLHQGDLFVIAGWVMAMVCLLVATAMPVRRRRTSNS